MKKLIIFIIVILLGCSRQIISQTELESLYQNFFHAIIQLNPEIATQLKLTEEMGFPYVNSQLTDNSIAAIETEYKVYQQYYELISGTDLKNLSEVERIDAAIFRSYLEIQVESEKFKYHSYQINSFFGEHASLLNLLTEYHPFADFRDAEAYLNRLRSIGKKLDQSSELINIQAEAGIIPPSYIISNYLEILEEFSSYEVAENPFITNFIDKTGNITEISNNEREKLIADAKDILISSVYPAYRRYIDEISFMRDKADSKAGVWKLPNGREYYEYCLRKQTTTDLKPAEIFRLGLQEVNRIQQDLSALFQQLGIADTLSFYEQNQAYWDLVWPQAEFHYPQTEEGKEQVLSDYRQIISRTAERLPDLFELLPSIPVIVQAVPPYKEKISGQYYQRAPLDGSRPAIFYTNLSWLPFKPGMQTLLYHETIPGHHLQIAIAQELPGQQLFRNLTFFTGFIEGWALYAEKLAYENGWFEDIYNQIGYLNSELFRAVRLVLDTGIHYKQWTREEARQYMEDNLGWSSYGELNRYILWPGQACAYKIGELKILELRDKVREELGDDFDLREFHTVILENGAAPLNLLETIVDNYLKDKKR